MTNNEVMKAIIHRRSTRRFKPDPIPENILNAILEAGLCAPSAGGRQSPIFAVCTDKAINDELGIINSGVLRDIQDFRPPEKPGEPKKPSPFPAGFEKQSQFGDAPVVVTIFAPKDWYNFTLDAACCAENMMIAAESLGVGSCMKARAIETFQSPRGREIQAQWGISEEYEAKVHMVFGYWEGDYPAPKPRREGRIIRV